MLLGKINSTLLLFAIIAELGLFETLRQLCKSYIQALSLFYEKISETYYVNLEIVFNKISYFSLYS